jgi:hypothetical protein
MKMTVKYFWTIAILFALTSCQENTLNDNKEAISEKEDIIHEGNDENADPQDEETAQLTVMVIPCSNGYDYNLKMGDLNPSLERYLDLDNRVKLEPFPLKKMQGTGYFGVFDKKHCDKILEKVDVDFLIMTRMRGMDLISENSNSANWGYDTKILNVKTMNQFDGIASKNLKSFELIDADIKSKSDQLVQLMIDSGNE